jgi:VanZ family protein
VLKKILLVIALLYSGTLAVVSLLSSNALPKVDVEYADKIFHAMAYALLSTMWYIVLKTHKYSKALTIAASVAVIYGIIIEVLQGTLTEARTLDVYDILANCIGIAFISVILIIRNKTQVKNL